MIEWEGNYYFQEGKKDMITNNKEKNEKIEKLVTKRNMHNLIIGYVLLTLVVFITPLYCIGAIKEIIFFKDIGLFILITMLLLIIWVFMSKMEINLKIFILEEVKNQWAEEL